MKVIDASVGFKALVTEADSAKAIQLVEDYRNGVTERTSTPLRSPIVSREPSGKAALLRSKEQNSLQPCFRICPVSYLRWRFCQKPTLSHRRCELASTTVSTWHSPSSMADRLIRTLQGKYHSCACVDLMDKLRPNGDSHVVRGSPDPAHPRTGKRNAPELRIHSPLENERKITSKTKDQEEDDEQDED